MASSPRQGIPNRFGYRLVQWHRENHQSVSYEDYLLKLQLLLDRGIAEVPTIYLDTNHWINLREKASLKGASAYHTLFRLLHRAVSCGRVLVVIHQTVFHEIAKQKEESLRGTSSLMDCLAQGVSLRPRSELDQLELAEFIRESSRNDLIQVAPAWTKVGLILKSRLPDSPVRSDEATKRAIFKATIDELWNASLTEVLSAFNWKTRDALGYCIDNSTVEAVNAQKMERMSGDVSFDDVRKQEAIGCWESGYALLAAYMLRQLFGRFRLGSRSNALRELAVSRFLEQRLGTFLPGFRISTELFCLFQKSNRRFRSSDWFDMQHASVALPYCSMFVTERALAHQLKNDLKLDREYDCVVTPDIDCAVEWIEAQ